MSQWSSAKAKRVLAALLRIGWSIKRESSSHKILSRPGWSDLVFAFHDKDEIGLKILARIAKEYRTRPSGFVT
jgi:predicted RNA binding protein YcfA (HicA-like mRNA interferase family)